MHPRPIQPAAPISIDTPLEQTYIEPNQEQLYKSGLFKQNKKAVLSQGNHAMPQLFFSV